MGTKIEKDAASIPNAKTNEDLSGLCQKLTSKNLTGLTLNQLSTKLGLNHFVASSKEILFLFAKSATWSSAIFPRPK